MGWHDMNEWNSGVWVVMVVVMVLILAVLIGLLVVFVRAVWHLPERENDRMGREAERLLAERFASGELDIAEYQRRKALLRAENR